MSRFSTYNGLPPDHYLWLVGQAAARLEQNRAIEADMPKRANRKYCLSEVQNLGMMRELGLAKMTKAFGAIPQAGVWRWWYFLP